MCQDGRKKIYKAHNLTSEQREKKRKLMMGNKLMLGRKLSKETIDKVINSRKWYKHSNETKNKIIRRIITFIFYRMQVATNLHRASF